MSKTEIIGQGSYGCVYRPSIQCDGNIGSDKYITKVQLEEDVTMNEKAIGKKITKIAKYEKHFAPILESCKLNTSKLKREDLDKCDLYDSDEETSFETNKIKYVGKNILTNGLYVLLNKYPKLFVRLLINTNIDVLKSVHILNSNNIIHMDLKQDNIVLKDKGSDPILIDFGLSFDTTRYVDEDVFFTYGYDYAPWCFEITLLAYMINKKGESWKSELVSEEDMKKVITDFVSYNKVFMRPLLNEFVTPFYGKTYELLYKACFETVKTWDGYGVCVVYYRLLETFNLHGELSLKPYIDILKSVIFCNPKARVDANEIIIKIKTEFDMESIRASKKKISKKISSMEKKGFEKMDKKIQKEYVDDLEQTKKYHESRKRLT
jgi:serine/threonine protein kinase